MEKEENLKVSFFIVTDHILSTEKPQNFFLSSLFFTFVHWLNKQENFCHENKFILCVIKIPKRSIDHKLQIKKKETKMKNLNFRST